MKQELIVIGGGEHAGVLIDTALAQPEIWNVIGFVDKMPWEETVLRFKIKKLGSDEDLDAILNNHPKAKLVIGVGNISRRNKIISSLSVPEDRWANLTHPSAIIASTVRLSYGIVVMSRAIIQTGSVVSEHAIVNNGVVIEHDVFIGKNTHIASGAVLGGGCNIGNNCTIGLGSRIRDHVSIGSGVTVGMGSVVVTDIPENETVVGVPARRISSESVINRVNISDICIIPETTLYEAMSILAKHGTMIVFVTDKDYKLLGIVAYEDIRNALLIDNDLDQHISKFMNVNYQYVTEETSRVVALEKMKALGITRMPVLDDNHRIVGLHLAEALIGNLCLNNIAVIMAGGLGERLKPLTDEIPKPMMKVAGHPILEHIILHLAASGIRTIYLAVNYLADVIEDYFKDGSMFGCCIHYLREKTPLGTAGALRLLPEKFKCPIFVVNGDLITHFDAQTMLYGHQKSKNIMTIGIHDYIQHIPYGVIDVDGTEVVSIYEKPEKHYNINGGIYIIEPELIDTVPDDNPFQMTELVSNTINNKQKVGVHLIEGSWVDVGQHKDLEIAQGRR
jgi:sugar O-acyltransferase (sialic acid O-acetyltransferase NeuD family)